MMNMFYRYHSKPQLLLPYRMYKWLCQCSEVRDCMNAWKEKQAACPVIVHCMGGLEVCVQVLYSHVACSFNWH